LLAEGDDPTTSYLISTQRERVRLVAWISYRIRYHHLPEIDELKLTRHDLHHTLVNCSIDAAPGWPLGERADHGSLDFFEHHCHHNSG